MSENIPNGIPQHGGASGYGQGYDGYLDEQGIYLGIPVGESKLLAVGAVPKRGPGYVPLVVELTAHRPLSASRVAVYAIRAYRTDFVYACKPKPLARGIDTTEIRDCWRERTGCELSEATLKGYL